MFHRIMLALAAVALGCTSPSADGDVAGTGSESGESGTQDEFGTLIDHLEWKALDAADDPLADHRPAMVDCGIAGWYLEQSTIEVQTNFCNYLAVGQPSLMALEQGQLVKVIFYHYDLVAPEAVLGHVAILVDGQMLWEKEIAIPGDANVFVEEFESPITAELGSPVVLHLHNHGQNTWVLQDLLAMP